MLNLERDVIEKIICDIDESGLLFKDFRLTKRDGHPEQIGKGGFSTVYEAEYTGDSEQKFVMKVIGFERHVMESEQFNKSIKVQRLLCEKISHICKIYAVRELYIVFDKDGNFSNVKEKFDKNWQGDYLRVQFIILEKLENIISKDKNMNVVPVNPDFCKEENVIEFAIQICFALNIAHQNNILHRDIKPENILWDSRNNRYKLCDFGMSTITKDGLADTVVFTDGFGAPEIVNRLSDYYDATADIYSFGITLYLIMNDFRFPASDRYKVNLVQYSPEFVLPAPQNASPDMSRIIQKMCAYRRDERYGSMADVLSDLMYLKEKSKSDNIQNYVEMTDFETETYKQTRKKRVDVIKQNDTKNLLEKKIEEKAYKRVYFLGFLKCTVVFSVLLFLVINGFQSDNSLIKDWRFYLLPLPVLFEAVFIEIKDFQYTFGILTLLFCGVSVYYCGLSFLHIMLMLSVIISVPMITAAGAIAAMIWMLPEYLGVKDIFSFLTKYDLYWIVFVGIYYMLIKILTIRVFFGKINNLRLNIETFILNKLPMFLIIAGILLFILKRTGVSVIREIDMLHPLIVGAITFLLNMLIVWLEDRADDNAMGQ